MNDKAGILIRVSTARQGERGASVKTQRQDCLAYAQRQSWQVVMVKEDHQTGTDFGRLTNPAYIGAGGPEPEGAVLVG